MNQEKINLLLEEALEHLENGRCRLALNLSKEAYQYNSDNVDVQICYAWALLENGEPVKSLELANRAVELGGFSFNSKMYRGYLLSRMSIFEGAISDINFAIEKQKDLLSWSYQNQCRANAGNGNFKEALSSIEKAILMHDDNSSSLKKTRTYIKLAIDITETNKREVQKDFNKIIKAAKDALENKDFWFTLFASQTLQNGNAKADKKELILLEISAMFYLLQYRPALKRANEVKKDFTENKKFQKIYHSLVDLTSREKINSINLENERAITSSKNNEKFSSEIKHSFTNKNVEIPSLKFFDYKKKEVKNKKYYDGINIEKINLIGVEVTFENKNYNEKEFLLEGYSLWYINDFEITKNHFKTKVEKDWESFVITQSAGEEEDNIWLKGIGKVEIYISDFKICEKRFLLGDIFIEDKQNDEEQLKQLPQKNINENKNREKELEQRRVKKDLNILMEGLNKFIGLSEIKLEIKNLINYIKFQKERENFGLKSVENISVNSIFLGNPGTGKTTIARLLGDIFHSMGLLENGHIIEVDRASLVGQYIGETAQKTDAKIKEAMGGILFIDEAYTLIKGDGNNQDFGKEAVDILLKRMEDMRGKFSVIVAGYPQEMEGFLDSNPGLKSRFTHTLNFADYNPQELLIIFEKYLNEEEYKISSEAKEYLKKELMILYRKRDKTFGNARTMRKIFDSAKLNLSSRVLQSGKEDLNEERLTTIIKSDIEKCFNINNIKEENIPINEEALEEALKKLNALVGLKKVKEDIKDIVKLAKYYQKENENISEKISGHIVFKGNPGTGKTTVARIISDVYSALGILKKGHLVETDREGLVASYIGQTAEKTKSKLREALGGTLFIDEAYALISGNSQSDFGKEAVNTILKFIDEEKENLLIITAGYSDEMEMFLESNPSLKSRFTRSYIFEDYNPDELFAITENLASQKGISISEEAKEGISKYYIEVYRNRDKTFGNARIVYNLLNSVYNKIILRLSESKDKQVTKSIIQEDILEFTQKLSIKKKFAIATNKENLETVLSELENMTGLETVKRRIQSLINSLKVAKLREKRGFNIIEKSLHAVFVGNPGTGKTTVARLMSKIYKELGILERGHLVEVDRSDLVAGYQGQTAIKTDKIIKEALGGTLFIDEAYTLSRGANDFGQEAIDTLLKQMEDYRNQFVVIVAGYTNEMKEFIDSNPGLKSRFDNLFYFEDYTPRELLTIAVNIAEVNGYMLDEGALQMFLEHFSYAYNHRDKNFGNARTARNLLYKAITYQEERIATINSLSDEELMLITYDDVEKINLKQLSI